MLDQYRRGHSRWLGLDEAHAQRSADALAEQMRALDAKMVQQCNVVLGVGVPAILGAVSHVTDRDRSRNDVLRGGDAR